jgi:hypothetical protein
MNFSAASTPSGMSAKTIRRGEQKGRWIAAACR